MEVLTRPSLGTRTSSLFDDSRTLWWPGAGPSPISPIPPPGSHQRFGPKPPPSPPVERITSNQLPPISDLLAFSQTDSAKSAHIRQQSYSNNSSPTNHVSPIPAKQIQQPPLLMQPRHEIQRIDPALFNDSKPRQSSSQTPPGSQIRRPTIDTSSYPPYPQTQSASTPYPHSAPVRSQYGETSPRTSVTAAPGPYYPSTQSRASHPMSAPVMPDPYRFPASLTTPQQPPDEPRPSQYQSVESRQRPRGSFHPYDPQSHHVHRRSSPGESSTAEDSSESRRTQSNGQRAPTGRNYVCPSCLKEFSRPSSLKIHEHSHSGAKPFICPRTGCGKNFSVRSNMKRHERGCHLGQPNTAPSTNDGPQYRQGVTGILLSGD